MLYNYALLKIVYLIILEFQQMSLAAKEYQVSHHHSLSHNLRVVLEMDVCISLFTYYFIIIFVN